MSEKEGLAAERKIMKAEERILSMKKEYIKDILEIDRYYRDLVKDLEKLSKEKEQEISELKNKIFVLESQTIIDQRQIKELENELSLKKEQIKFYKTQMTVLQNYFKKSETLIDSLRTEVTDDLASLQDSIEIDSVENSYFDTTKILLHEINRFSTKEEVTSLQPIKSIKLKNLFRNKGKPMSKKDAETMIKMYGFFDIELNKEGKGFDNDFEIRKIENEFVVIDLNSGLMWQQIGCYEVTYIVAQDWIKNLNRISYAGYSDWRLPTLEEAMSLMEPQKRESSNNIFTIPRRSLDKGGLYIDPVFDHSQMWIWTMDKIKGGKWGWVASYSFGGCYDLKSLNTAHVRAVRSIHLTKE